jgi:hypothetical protein
VDVQGDGGAVGEVNWVVARQWRRCWPAKQVLDGGAGEREKRDGARLSEIRAMARLLGIQQLLGNRPGKQLLSLRARGGE